MATRTLPLTPGAGISVFNQPASRNVRDLQLAEGQPGAYAAAAQDRARDIAVSVPNVPAPSPTAPPQSQSQLFGIALQDLLRQSQQMGTRGFAEQGFAARQQQINRGIATPEEFIGAAPSTQAGVRSAAESALQPTISGAQQSQQTFGEQIRGVGNVIAEARQLQQDIESQQQRTKDEARKNVQFFLERGGTDALEALAKEQPDLLKQVGYDAKTIQTLIPILRARETAPQKKMETDAVADLAQKYPDAGITFSDTFAQAQAKLPRSRIYQQATRLVSGGGGGVTAAGRVSGGRAAAPSDVETATGQQPVIDSRLKDVTGKPVKLTAPQSDALQGFDTSLDLLNQAKSLARKVNTGPLAGRFGSIGTKLGRSNTDFVRLDATLRNLQASYQKAISGAAISEQEAARLSAFLPSVNDDEEVLQTKASVLEQALRGQRARLLGQLGVSQSQTQVPLTPATPTTASNDPLGIR